MLDDYDNNAEDDNRMSRDPYGGGGGGSGRNHPPRPTSGGHRSFERPRAWPPSPSFGCVDLQIGNHLRTVHPSPMSTDQVVAVPGMFGSELNVTSFWEIRDELEPLLRVKYSHIATNSHGNTPREDGDGGVWRLDMVRGCVILVAPQFQAQPTAFGGGEEQEEEEGGDGHPGSRRTLSTLVVAPSHVRDSSNSGGGGGGGRDAESQAAAGAVPAVARAFLRICEYLSIHPGSAVVNAGITLGRPTAKLRPAHSYVCPSASKINCP